MDEAPVYESTMDESPMDDEPSVTPEVTRSEPRIPSGWRVIASKEFADQLLGWRFIVLLLMLGLIGIFTTASVASVIRGAAQIATGIPALFLFMFTRPSTPTANVSVPEFVYWVALFGPFLGIVFGFDAISSERSAGTLPRLVSQPIHRDDVINGKFAASLTVIALVFGVVMVIIGAAGIIQLGVVPSADDVLRLVAWSFLAIVYVGLWLAFAMLCSIVFRRASTAALLTFSAWLIFGLFWGFLSPLLTGFLAPVDSSAPVNVQLAAATLANNIDRISPIVLFQEVSRTVLDPTARFVGVILPTQTSNTATILPLEQSLLICWPLIVAMVAELVVFFAVAYVVFMRQEVRA